MGSSNEEEGKSVSGEVMTAEEAKKKMAIREQNRGPIVGAIFSRLSRIPFFNMWLEKKVSTSRKVVREEKGLFDDLAEHERSFKRLLDIDVIVREDNAQREANATAAENRLAAEKRIAAAREKDDAIYRTNKEREETEADMKNKYDLQILEANYKIQLDPLAKAVKKSEKPEPEPKKTTTRGRSPKQKKREEVITKYEREIARIEASRKTEKAKATLKKAAEAEKEEELQKIENMP